MPRTLNHRLDSTLGRIVEEVMYDLARRGSAAGVLIEPSHRGGIVRPEIREKIEDRFRDAIWSSLYDMTGRELDSFARHLDGKR